MSVVDISMYQQALALHELPDTVTGVIIKATQGRFTDPQFWRFRQEAKDTRWKWVGLYHFLSEGGAAEFDYYQSVVGELGPREFVALDWERNAITGYLPPAGDAHDWMVRAEQRWPGRCCWYSYRSLAAAARQSGEFPWPLWLADPNADGRDWAHRLGAFLLQYGQEMFNGVNVDVNEIFDIATLDELTEDTTMTPEQFATMLGPTARANGGTVELQLNDGNWYPFAAVMQYIHTEAQRDTGSGGPLTINLTGTAS